MKISREELDEYAELNARRKELDKESRTISVRCKQIEAKVLEQMQADGKQHCKRHGYSLAIVAGRATVAWKDAFVAECGAERAAELQASAVAPEKVTITPPA